MIYRKPASTGVSSCGTDTSRAPGGPARSLGCDPCREAMKPVERLHRIDASKSVAKALDAIVQEDVNQLPVVEKGQIRGVISRDQLLRLVDACAELTM